MRDVFVDGEKVVTAMRVLSVAEAFILCQGLTQCVVLLESNKVPPERLRDYSSVPNHPAFCAASSWASR
jgi:hypothetical protein